MSPSSRLRIPCIVVASLLAACSSSERDDGAAGTPGGPGASASSGATGAGGEPGSSGSGGDTGTGGGSGSGGAAVGDRYVATDGTDRGDCSQAPCRTLAYAGQQMQTGEVLVIGDGTYPDAVDNSTFPHGSASAFTTIVAAHDGKTTLTGSFDLNENTDFFLEFRGLRVETAGQKGVAGGSVHFYRMSFVGGPPAGNTVAFGVGTNDFAPGAWDILCEDCIFRGLGGRYAALVYRAENVTLRRAVARKDGGWGLDGPDSTEFEPEGVIVFYESKDSTCEQCVALDSIKASDDSAEALGAIIQNSHTDQHTNVAFEQCFAVANQYSGFAFEGNGSVGDATVTDSLSAGNALNGITANVDGALTLTRIASVANDGTGVASYGDANITLTDSVVTGNGGGALDGVSGSTNGAGPGSIDLTAFDDARLQAELCELAAVSRGWCGSGLSFQDYLGTFR